MNGRYRARTCDPLIKSQLTEKRKSLQEQGVTKTAHGGGALPGALSLREGGADGAQIASDLARLTEWWATASADERAAILKAARLDH